MIDAERGVRDALRETLATWGCRATVGRSTSAALQRHAAMHEDEVPEVLIVDVGARDADSGLEAVRAVREEFNVDIPALLTTAETSPNGFRALTADGIRVLHRPYTPEALREALTALSTSGERGEAADLTAYAAAA